MFVKLGINDNFHPLSARTTYKKLNTAGSIFSFFFSYSTYIQCVTHVYRRCCCVWVFFVRCAAFFIRVRVPCAPKTLPRDIFFFFGGSSKKSLRLPLGLPNDPPPHPLAKPGLAYELVQPQHQQSASEDTASHEPQRIRTKNQAPCCRCNHPIITKGTRVPKKNIRTSSSSRAPKNSTRFFCSPLCFSYETTPTPMRGTRAHGRAAL